MAQNLPGQPAVRYRVNVTRYHENLSLRPTGLADGLALKE
jgi:hypothetical protein